ncbi:MAG TPA: hypothetical protein VEB64_01490 [Azospirillaceae bacterium]|nr:hypothetical protein [Azospirillaceae bacterium]
MPITLNSQLVDEYATLIRVEGVRDVSHWTLPNNGVPFDENAALSSFCEDMNGLFDMTYFAINAIASK